MRGAASSEIPYFAFRENRISPYQRRITALLCVLLLLATTAIAAAQDISSSKSKKPKPTPCSTLISKCGCTITSPGFYQVQKALSTPSTLNPEDNSCIAVSAPSVTLWLADYPIDDVSWTAGIGIHLNSSAKNSFIAGGDSIISQWTTGIEDEASNVTITGVITDNNTAAGILVQNATSVRIDNFGSHANGSYGVQLNGTAHSEVSGGVVDSLDTDPLGTNLIAGIAVGPTISKPIKASNGVRIFSNCVMGNGGVGIELEGNVSDTKVTGNYVCGNVSDLSDMNNDCGSNLWFGNVFETGSPATCIGSTPAPGCTCPQEDDASTR